MARITIKDIANQLNINPSTVSRALRDHPDVSQQLKENIRDLAQKLGYRPNHLAINLRRGKSHTIGLIIPEISTFFFPSVIRAIEAAAHEKGYNLLILHSNDSLDREIENAEICANLGVDGVLVSLSRQSNDLDHFSELQQQGTPIVYFDKVLAASDTHKVVIPGDLAATMAIGKLLADRPYARKITGFFADKRLSITEDRITGFRSALQDKGKAVSEDDLLFPDSAEEAARMFLERWQPGELRPDALFVMSDELLSGIVQAVYQLGLRVPEDLYIISLSDGHLPRYLPFRIPYVCTSGYELGQAAAARLFQLIMKLPILPGTEYAGISLVNG